MEFSSEQGRRLMPPTAPSTSRARGENAPESPGSSSPSVPSEKLEPQAGQISNLEIRGQSGVEFSPSQRRPPMPPSDPSRRSNEASMAGRAEEPNFGAENELHFEEAPEIQLFGPNAAPNLPYVSYGPQRTPPSLGPPGGDGNFIEGRHSATSVSHSEIPMLGRNSPRRGDVFGPEGSQRATSGDAVEDPSHAGARSQTTRGTPGGEAEMNPADNMSHLRTQMGDGVPQKLPLMQEPDVKRIDSHQSEVGYDARSDETERRSLFNPAAGAGSSSTVTQMQVDHGSEDAKPRSSGGKRRVRSAAALAASAEVTDTSELSSRIDTDSFRPLTEQGVLGTVQEHVQVLGTMIMSLDTKEDHPDGRRVANFAGDALMSLASWGTKTREELKEEVRRVDCRLHEVLDSISQGIETQSPSDAHEALREMTASYLYEAKSREKVESDWDELAAHLKMMHKDRENQIRGEIDEEYNQDRLQALRRNEQLQLQRDELQQQLSESLGRLPAEQEKTLEAQTEMAKARSNLDKSKLEIEQLRERLSRREQEIAELEESQQSGGIPLSQQGQSITREESLQAELDEQVQMREHLSDQMSDLRAQLDLANQQAVKLGRKLGDTKLSAKHQLEEIKQRFDAKLMDQREHTERALGALSQLEAMQAGSASGSPEEILAAITTRMDQDQVVAQLSDQLKEARTAADQRQSEITQLKQQMSTLTGRYSKEESVKKQKIADQSRDLRATQQQLEHALAEGERLRDSSQQLVNHRRPRGDDLCNDPDHQNLVSQIQIAKTQMREVQAENDRGRLREAKLSQEHAKETESFREAREAWHSERQRQADTIDRLNRSLTVQREASASKEQDLRSQMEGLVDPGVSVVSSEQALELSSMQSAYREAEERNEKLQEQSATLQVKLAQVADQRDDLQAQLSSQSKPSRRSTTGEEPSPSYGVQLLMSPPSSSTSYGMPTSSHGVQLELEDCEQTPMRNAAGQFYALNLHEPTLSLVTRNVVRFKELVRDNPFCFVMVFAYEWSRSNQSSQDNALQSAIQFCLQPGLDPASDLRQCSEPAKGYVVRHGFMTGITFSRAVASASLRGAQNVRDYLFKPDSPFTFVPEAVEGNLVECCTRSFDPDWYSQHCQQADYPYPSYNYWHPLMPEWVQLFHGIPGQYLHAVTAYLFRHGHPEPDFRWIRGYEEEPDEEEDGDAFESLWESLVPTVTPSAPGRRGERTRSSRSPLPDAAPRLPEIPPPRVAIQTPDQSSYRTRAAEEPSTELPGFGRGYAPLRSSMRQSSGIRIMQRNQSGGSSRADRDTYVEDESEEGGPEDDHVSVTSNVSEAGSSPIERARMTEAEKHRLLSNQELMHKPRVVKAVQQVASAKVARDGTSTVGEVKTLTVPPPPMRPSSKNPDYVKESNKCRVTELLSLKTELVKVLSFFKPQSRGPEGGTQQEREDWWYSRNGRPRLMRVLKAALMASYPWASVHESLGDALHDVKSASWIMELHQQLNSVVNLFTATPHHYIEILLFMCDETAVPNSDSVERWKADWDNLKMLATLVETAAKVEETAVKHLGESCPTLYTRADTAAKVHQRFIECLINSKQRKDNLLVPWLTAELSERAHTEPKGFQDISAISKKNGAIYEWRSILRVSQEEGRKKENEMVAVVKMEDSHDPREQSRHHLVPRTQRAASSLPPIQPPVAALTESLGEQIEEGESPQLPNLGRVAALPAATTSGRNLAVSVGYVGEKRNRPSNGRGIVIKGFYERHQADLQGYPGGQKAFEEISLNTYMRDQLSKASKQDDQGNYIDQRTAMLIGFTCPWKPIDSKWQDMTSFPSQYGPSWNKEANAADSFAPGGCPHCAHGLSPLKMEAGMTRHSYLYRQENKADSAHDWADCPRVKAALFYWSRQYDVLPDTPQCHKGHAVLKRLMMRCPGGPKDKFKVNGRLPCEEAVDKDFMASERPNRPNRQQEQ